MAAARWRAPEEHSIPLTWARREQRRLAGLKGSSKGTRSTHDLALHLRGLEQLGLIRRDVTRDAVIVTDPACAGSRSPCRSRRSTARTAALAVTCWGCPLALSGGAAARTLALRVPARGRTTSGARNECLPGLGSSGETLPRRPSLRPS